MTPDQERAEQATVMTEIKELIAQLRAMVALTNEVPRIPALPRQLATEAASALEALISRSAVMEEALRYAEAVSTATVDYFLKRGDKEVAAYHIRHRSHLQAARSALSLKAGKE